MLDIQKFIGRPKILVSNTDELTTRFEVKNLPRGFWHTLGNALRRIILGYSIWAAITWMKIKGVAHEYHVIDGVKESVIDIMLNFKKLRFNLDEKVEATQRISQRFSGTGIYTSKNLKLPSGIELLNDDVHLFEVSDPSLEINMEIRVEKWYWYFSIDYLRARDKKEDSDANILLIDNEFKMVEYVKYDVEEIIEDFSGSTKDELVL